MSRTSLNGRREEPKDHRQQTAPEDSVFAFFRVKVAKRLGVRGQRCKGNLASSTPLSRGRTRNFLPVTSPCGGVPKPVLRYSAYSPFNTPTPTKAVSRLRACHAQLQDVGASSVKPFVHHNVCQLEGKAQGREARASLPRQHHFQEIERRSFPQRRSLPQRPKPLLCGLPRALLQHAPTSTNMLPPRGLAVIRPANIIRPIHAQITSLH
jgi:hypothetical protein